MQSPATSNHRLPVTIKSALQLLPQSSASHRSASLCFALQHVTDQCSVQPRPVSLHHRSKFTIKTWPQLLPQMHESGRGYLRSAVLQHRTPLRPAQLSNAMPQLSNAMPCEVGPCFAKYRHRSRFTIKTWPHVCQPFVVKAGNLQTLQILAFRILASPCNALHRHRSGFTIKTLLITSSPSW